MIRLFVPAAVAALLLSACGPAKVIKVDPMDGVVSGDCHVDMVKGAVGLAASDQTIERARVDSDSSEVRVVKAGHTEGEAAESGGTRLTVETGATHDITRVSCG